MPVYLNAQGEESRGWGFTRRMICIAFVGAVLFALAHGAQATPPEYRTFGRDQKVSYTPKPDSLLRIWIVYVGQGDGILIQLPEKYNYDPDPADKHPARTERLDILVDAGSFDNDDVSLMHDFICRLYGGCTPVIEHAILTHHDKDHVAGLTYLLNQNDIAVENVYHNGLASYRPGTHGFPKDSPPANLLCTAKDGEIGRCMAFLDDSGLKLAPQYLIGDIYALESAEAEGALDGLYHEFAEAVLAGSRGGQRREFLRACVGNPFIMDVEGASGRVIKLDGLAINLLWPERDLVRYGSDDKAWGETINGNSVTFRLQYGEFSMLFPGDQNEKSQEALLAELKKNGHEKELACQMLKLPHHGSAHSSMTFLNAVAPVLSVASMGEQGFQSKRLSRLAWEHPSTDVIQWLGGFHRVYETFIQEKPFDYDAIGSEADRAALIERADILIETDGQCFRIVEVPCDWPDLNKPPTVQESARGDGTRWVVAQKP